MQQGRENAVAMLRGSLVCGGHGKRREGVVYHFGRSEQIEWVWARYRRMGRVEIPRPVIALTLALALKPIFIPMPVPRVTS